ncbi:hypothetical protein RhiirA4_484621 [Rhizophagus irregularis]|uniref:Uncharacterized protein n=1 Tax=Rhizophagus irregularis TaxID=588596 RepID=A0A2I1HP58_9GLOM|nr:hypothetical protein RhiirA4_484621 [Rhizophagus irregularis]
MIVGEVIVGEYCFNLLFGLWISISFSFALRIGIYQLRSFISDWSTLKLPLYRSFQNSVYVIIT